MESLPAKEPPIDRQDAATVATSASVSIARASHRSDTVRPRRRSTYATKRNILNESSLGNSAKELLVSGKFVLRKRLPVSNSYKLESIDNITCNSHGGGLQYAELPNSAH